MPGQIANALKNEENIARVTDGSIVSLIPQDRNITGRAVYPILQVVKDYPNSLDNKAGTQPTSNVPSYIFGNGEFGLDDFMYGESADSLRLAAGFKY